MSDVTFIRGSLRSGAWVAELQCDTCTPDLEVRHLDQVLQGASLTAGAEAGLWLLRVPVPAELLNEGVHTFLVIDRATTTTVERFTIVTGALLEDDIRAEVSMLRAELDLLKRAFRRHCAEAGAA